MDIRGRRPRWIDSAAAFLRTHAESLERDFVFGYVTHVLTDVYNNIQVWRSYLEAHKGEWERLGRDNPSHRESWLIDRRLYQTFERRPEVWGYLERSRCFDFDGRVSEEEITSIKHNILYKQYSDISDEAIDTSENKLRTYDDALGFIDGAVKFICKELNLGRY